MGASVTDASRGDIDRILDTLFEVLRENGYQK